jgi:hypothetical protein
MAIKQRAGFTALEAVDQFSIHPPALCGVTRRALLALRHPSGNSARQIFPTIQFRDVLQQAHNAFAGGL